MVVNRRKKVHKYRGSSSHGGGGRKKRRGAGSRGGRGNAGTGKRAGHAQYGVVLGKLGFLPRRQKTLDATINLDYFTSYQLDQQIKDGKVTKESTHYLINLKKLGFSKLLGQGKCAFKLKVDGGKVSRKAEEKIKEAGGEIAEEALSGRKAAKNESAR